MFIRDSLIWKPVVVALTGAVVGSVLSACSGEDDETEGLPEGVLDICQNWSEEEYDERTSDALEIMGEENTGFNPAPRAYFAASCGGQTSPLRYAVSSFSQELSESEGSKAFEFPEMLPRIFDMYLEAEGLAAGWSAVVLENSSSENDTDEEQLVLTLQEYVGVSLAEVTDPGREFSLEQDYVDALRDLGTVKFETRKYYASEEWSSDWNLDKSGPVVHGWSVLAPLLRFGEFHEDFLTPVATDIVEFDQEVDGDWSVEGEEQISFDMFAPDATDAMEPVLEALSRNLDAAEQVFDATGDSRVEELLGEVSDDD